MEELSEAAVTVVKATEQFGADLYREVAKSGGNVLVCPLSAETILALIYQGANGKTAEEFSTTLHLPADKQIVANGFEQLANAITTSDKVTLCTANKIYLDQNVAILDTFKTVAVDGFKSEVENVQFKDKASALAKINGWVAKQTRDKIQSIFDDLPRDTVMVLLNAIYFFGNWLHPFKLIDELKPFRTSLTTSVDVQMMRVEKRLRYFEDADLNVQVVELPYQDKDFSLVIVLPREVDGLAQVEQKLPIDLSRERFSAATVNVTMPKFKLEKTIPLTGVLQQLGIKEGFGGNADFSGISPVPLCISEAIQKTFIDVNEKGTEAAAVTGMRLMKRKYHYPDVEPVHIDVDRPFLFQLTRVDGVLFCGRYVQTGLVIIEENIE